MDQFGDWSGDQAGTLRRLMSSRVAIRAQTMRPVRVISVTSGKGGVGKTNVVANLSVLLQRAGHRVLVLDGDFGLANLNIVMGLDAKHTIFDVLSGEKSLSDVILTGPSGVKVIPASSGIFKMTQLSMAEKSLMMQYMEESNVAFDILLIDTGAGISSDVTYLNTAATEILVVVTPEPTSIADAYALMKVMSQEHRIKRFKLLVNMAASAREALGVYNNLLQVSDRFLNIQIEYIGHVTEDKKVSQAVKARKILCDAWPDSQAAKCFDLITKSLLETPAKPELSGGIQLFWKTLLTEAR